MPSSAPGAEAGEVSAEDPTPAPEQILAGVLTDPRSVMFAMDEHGFRIALPSGLELPAHRTLEVAGENRTVVDLVIGDDMLTVVDAWQRTLDTGSSAATVHSRNAPDSALRLTFVDARAPYGVWLGALAPAGYPDSVADATSWVGPLTVSPRPRTGVVTKDRLGVITAVDDRAARMLGCSAADLVGIRSTEFVHPDDQQRAVANWLDLLGTGNNQRLRLRYRTGDRGWAWVELENEINQPGPGEQVTVTCQMTDISDEMAAHEAVAGREALFRRLTEALPIGMVRIELDGTISYANPRVAEIFGAPTRPTVGEQLELVVAEDRARVAELLAARGTDAGPTMDDLSFEVSIRRPDTGQLRRCAVSLVSLSDREGAPGVLGYLQDITDSARLREELHIRATFDALTGCHNRASIVSALDHALTTGTPQSTWVLFVDLDGFKEVNDRHGHAVGDEVLVYVADELRSVVRGGDAVGRLGGDEFLVVLAGIEEPAQVVVIAERAAAVLDRSVEIAGVAVQLGASIGIACADSSDTGATLTARADAAMYRAKARRSAQRAAEPAGGPVRRTRRAASAAASG